MTKLKMRDWAVQERPREKLMIHGRRVMSDSELLAILVSSGTVDESAVELGRRILASVGHDLYRLSKMELADLMRFRGIGRAKAATIIAALELGRRRQKKQPVEYSLMNSSKLAYQYLKQELQDLSHEEFWVMFLNSGSRVVGKSLISVGGQDYTPVDMRILMRKALEMKATGIIIAHNHPSGTLEPSQADLNLTRMVAQAGELLNIALVDHLIITEKSYFSFRDEGLDF